MRLSSINLVLFSSIPVFASPLAFTKTSISKSSSHSLVARAPQATKCGDYEYTEDEIISAFDLGRAESAASATIQALDGHTYPTQFYNIESIPLTSCSTLQPPYIAFPILRSTNNNTNTSPPFIPNTPQGPDRVIYKEISPSQYQFCGVVTRDQGDTSTRQDGSGQGQGQGVGDTSDGGVGEGIDGYTMDWNKLTACQGVTVTNVLPTLPLVLGLPNGKPVVVMPGSGSIPSSASMSTTMSVSASASTSNSVFQSTLTLSSISSSSSTSTSTSTSPSNSATTSATATTSAVSLPEVSGILNSLKSLTSSLSDHHHHLG